MKARGRMRASSSTESRLRQSKSAAASRCPRSCSSPGSRRTRTSGFGTGSPFPARLPHPHLRYAGRGRQRHILVRWGRHPLAHDLGHRERGGRVGIDERGPNGHHARGCPAEPIPRRNHDRFRARQSRARAPLGLRRGRTARCGARRRTALGGAARCILASR